jgi:3-phosphoglycerate kinase
LAKKSLRDVELKGRRLLMRVDFNVPLTKEGDVADDTRIKAAMPSIEYAAGKGAAVILVSHLGRPKGKDPSKSLKVVAYRLSELTSYPVKFAGDCIGPEAEEKVEQLKFGEILLLENVRFYPQETYNDGDFAGKLSAHGDIYCNDAFGTAHRAHASTSGVAEYFPERVAGFLMEKELNTLGSLLTDPQRPFIAVLGGAKVTGKIGVVSNLMNRVDRILIGGGMAFTFLKSVGLEVGSSLVDDNFLGTCRELMGNSGEGEDRRIFLPVDCVVADSVDNPSEHETVSTGAIAEDRMGVDIGEKTRDVFVEEINRAKTVFWNGPMGVFEIPDFAEGTRTIGRAIAKVDEREGKTVVGGGDTVAAVEKMHISGRITHISTGGGASLSFLEGSELPGVEALSDSD